MLRKNIPKLNLTRHFFQTGTVVILALLGTPAIPDDIREETGFGNHNIRSGQLGKKSAIGGQQAGGGLDDAPPLFSPKVSSKDLATLQRKLGKAASIEDLDKAITTLQNLLTELYQEKSKEQNYIKDVRKLINETMQDIASTKEKIADLEHDIETVTLMTNGMGTPPLLAELSEEQDKLDNLQKNLDKYESEKHQYEVNIQKIDVLIQQTKQKLAAKKEEKKQLLSVLSKSYITLPNEGARLLVDSDQEIRLHAERSPTSVRLKIEKVSTLNRANSTQSGKPFKYERNWKWKSLESVGEKDVRLRFRTAAELTNRSIAVRPGELKLTPGTYRISVQFSTLPSMWKVRTFTVVGKLDSSSVQKGMPLKPRNSAGKDTSPSTSTNTGESDATSNKTQIKSPLLNIRP